MSATAEHRYSAEDFVRITVLVATEAGKPVKRTYWAKPGKRTAERAFFTVVDKEGDPCPENTLHYLVCTPREILKEQRARLNLHYVELELVP